MRENEYPRAISVIDELFKHPASTLFQTPVEKDKETENDYFQIVKNPQDLGTIRKRLVSKEYKLIKDWLDDIEMVWSNAELYNGSEHYVSHLANYCRTIFRKELKNHHLQTIEAWCKDVYKFRTKVSETMAQPPPKVKQYAGSLNAGRSLKQSSQNSYMSDKELSSLVTAAEKLVSEEHQREMIRILNEFQPDLDLGESELSLDLSRLHPHTLQALREYMKSAYEKNGEKFPE